jgi:hypothetical protein
MVAVALVMCLVPACKPKVVASGPPPKPVAAKTNTVAAVTNTPLPENASVFVELMPPKGKDPFFPNSHRRDPAPPPVVITEKPQPAATLVLKGIIGLAPHRLAIFDGAILETGESGNVRTPNGKVRVKCIEIGEDYANIQVLGEEQPKRLELKKKGP